MGPVSAAGTDTVMAMPDPTDAARSLVRLLFDAGQDGTWLLVAGTVGTDGQVARLELTRPVTAADLAVLVIGRQWPPWATAAAVIDDGTALAVSDNLLAALPASQVPDPLLSALLTHSLTGPGTSPPPGGRADAAELDGQVRDRVDAFIRSSDDTDLAAACALLVRQGNLRLADTLVTRLS